jgi:ATP-binding protein involved in chromosome partitioning
MSGKGGVGKSYVTAALALGAQARLTRGVGVLDADLHGPTTASLLSAAGPVQVHEEGVQPPVGADGVKVFSTEHLLGQDTALKWQGSGNEGFVWRGALEAGALREFLSDVSWGALDLLLVDLPPGTGSLSDLSELVPSLTGAIAVTIPSEESRRSVARAIEVATARDIAILGIIENMSGYACESCGERRPLFRGRAGERLAQHFSVPLLGRVPFSPSPTVDSTDEPQTPPRIPSDILDRFLEAILP